MQWTIQRAALTVAGVSSFVTPLMGSSVNVALPGIGRDFQLDAVTLSWIAAAYILAAAVGLLPAGRLADIHGRKKVFGLGMALFTLACLLAALAPGVEWLMACRVLQGLGNAMTFATGMAIVSSAYPPNERGKAIGSLVSVVYLGLAAGPFIGGLLTEYLTWRSVFAMAVPLGAFSTWLTFAALKTEWADAAGERIDWTGAIVYGAALIGLMEGFTRLPGSTGLLLIAAGSVGLALFAWLENRLDQPLFDVSLFTGNRVFALSSLAALISYAATFAVTFMLSLYLQNIQGLSARSAGLVLVVSPLVMALLSPTAGRLSDRVQPRIVASAGMFITAVALVILAFLDSGKSLAYVIAGLAVQGVGFALFSSPNMNAIMGSVDKRQYGLASGSVGAMRLLGQMMSMGAAASVMAVYVGPVQISPEVHGGFITALHVSFLIFTGLCLVGAVCSLARGKLARTPGPTR